MVEIYGFLFRRLHNSWPPVEEEIIQRYSQRELRFEDAIIDGIGIYVYLLSVNNPLYHQWSCCTLTYSVLKESQMECKLCGDGVTFLWLPSRICRWKESWRAQQRGLGNKGRLFWFVWSLLASPCGIGFQRRHLPFPTASSPWTPNGSHPYMRPSGVLRLKEWRVGGRNSQICLFKL